MQSLTSNHTQIVSGGTSHNYVEDIATAGSTLYVAQLSSSLAGWAITQTLPNTVFATAAGLTTLGTLASTAPFSLAAAVTLYQHPEYVSHLSEKLNWYLSGN